jgi:hypothetical protein
MPDLKSAAAKQAAAKHAAAKHAAANSPKPCVGKNTD